MKILSTNISQNKGTIKESVPYIEINAHGVIGDAHAGNWHRQVSLLGIESIENFQDKLERKIEYGEFAENLTTQGIELYKTAPLDRLIFGNVELMVTQIGKKCHGSNCAIFSQVGSCIMPKEGIFCKVIKGGVLKAGDNFIHKPYILKTKIITLSDRASKGEYEDLSGPLIKKMIQENLATHNRNYSIDTTIIPDEPQILETLINRSVSENYDIIITTGGTGIGPRDITPDVIKPLLDKEITGIMEMIRVKYGTLKPNALLSRSIAGVIKQTLVYVLPGSVKGVTEYMNEILPTINHSIMMLHGIDNH